LYRFIRSPAAWNITFGGAAGQRFAIRPENRYVRIARRMAVLVDASDTMVPRSEVTFLRTLRDAITANGFLAIRPAVSPGII
jgi:hypothetical protein